MKIAGVALWIWGIGFLVGAGGLAAIKMTSRDGRQSPEVELVKSKVEDKKEQLPQQNPSTPEKPSPILVEFFTAVQDEQRSINEDAFSSKTKAWSDRVRELEKSSLTVASPELIRTIGRYRHTMQMAHLNLESLKKEVVWRKLVMDARKNGRATRPRVVRNEAVEALSDSELQAEIAKLTARCETLLWMTLEDIEANKMD